VNVLLVPAHPGFPGQIPQSRKTVVLCVCVYRSFKVFSAVTFIMGKVSLADKMQIQSSCEQLLGAKAVMAAYPDKGWALSTVKKICQRVDRTGLATECKAGCGRPKSARSEANIAAVIF